MMEEAAIKFSFSSAAATRFVPYLLLPQLEDLARHERLVFD